MPETALDNRQRQSATEQAKQGGESTAADDAVARRHNRWRLLAQAMFQDVGLAAMRTPAWAMPAQRRPGNASVAAAAG